MPKRNDIKSIMILGAGPIIIGQACEFDYSGVQACKVLREEGYRVILVNSNPATIMTDPDLTDATYIEPIHWEIIEKIFEKERPDALLPTLGGQTALNCALDLHIKGVLKKFNVEMIGATADVINKAEDRKCFELIVKNIGLETARSGRANNLEEARSILLYIGFPCIIRPSFTMGGSGSGIAYNREEFEEICSSGLELSPIKQLLIDESLIGWKEYEMEVVRDNNDNCIIVCSIENIDPMGIHTGDSITVAPAQTLTDKEYQSMRNASINILSAIGVSTGGANVQFAVNPQTGRLVVIEMNPRVSRSSALASKATGFPIAKIAVKLAIGYSLDELTNEITNGQTPASFEPTIDYVVTKIPRFNFEKFIGTNDRLTTQMKSVGEVMAIGRSMQESLQKALCGLEIGSHGLESKINVSNPNFIEKIYKELKEAGGYRLWYIADAFRGGVSINTVYDLTNIDRWFLFQIKELVTLENDLLNNGKSLLTINNLRYLKRKGFSDTRIGFLVGEDEISIRELRYKYNIHPVYKRIDTCSAEFDTETAYMYSTYEDECESNPNNNPKKILVLGGGPNRIGQGIEFDYCCVHALLALREEGYETIMVNCNPETVSTDYEISDRLYFEPVTIENVLDIIRIENPSGVIVQFGGQTPLNIAKNLEKMRVKIMGTRSHAIDCAEDRSCFKNILKRLGLKQPTNVTVTDMNLIKEKADIIGYPLVVRPSYVLGGQAMVIVYNYEELIHYFYTHHIVENDYPVLLEKYLNDAVEVDIDAIFDGQNILIGGILEHIEQAGVHSGDSACTLPAYTLSNDLQDKMRKQVKTIAMELQVVGLINIQFAVKNNEIYLIEVNPRASRTIPFVSKATGVTLAKVATRVMVGKSLLDQGLTNEIIPPYFSVKQVIMPFNKFPEIDPVLGPEMRSTGEVMGIGYTFSEAFAKAMLASNCNVPIPKNGRVLLSVSEDDKHRVIDLALMLINHGFNLDATGGTAYILKKAGIEVRLVEGHLNIKDRIKNGEYSYIVNTTDGRKGYIRNSAIKYQVHYDTTINGGLATARSLNINPLTSVSSLQEFQLKCYPIIQ